MLIIVLIMKNNNKLITLGNSIFDYIVISILLNISFITVIPFVPILVGVVEYFNTNTNERSLFTIFTTIKKNIQMIFKVTVLYVIVLGSIVLNLYAIEPTVYAVDIMITGLSYIGLFILSNIIINGPIIILKMNVSLRELIVNCIYLIFGDIKNYVLIIVTIFIFIYGITFSYVLLIFGIYFVILLIEKLTFINFIKLKERMK